MKSPSRTPREYAAGVHGAASTRDEIDAHLATRRARRLGKKTHMKFLPRCLVCNDDGLIGEYRIELTHGGWRAEWSGQHGAWDQRLAAVIVVGIDACGPDGNACNWESVELARAACMHHQRLLASMSPQQAADEVARLDAIMALEVERR